MELWLGVVKKCRNGLVVQTLAPRSTQSSLLLRSVKRLPEMYLDLVVKSKLWFIVAVVHSGSVVLRQLNPIFKTGAIKECLPLSLTDPPYSHPPYFCHWNIPTLQSFFGVLSYFYVFTVFNNFLKMNPFISEYSKLKLPPVIKGNFDSLYKMTSILCLF